MLLKYPLRPLSAKELTDISAICYEGTNENFSQNDFYGDAYVLKTFCGFPIKKSTDGVIPHGIYCGKVCENDLNSGLRKAYLPNLIQQSDYLSSGFKNFTIGSPFCYAAKLEEHSQPPSKEGTAVFPLHSTEHVTCTYDQTQFIDFLIALPNKFKPLKVMLYWADILRGHHLPFVEAGFDCFTAGHMTNPFFLMNLIKLFRTTTYTITNGLGSHCFYANYIGNPVYMFEQKPLFTASDESLINRSEVKNIFKVYKKYITDKNFSYYPYQEYLSNLILGCQYFQTRNRLRSIFEN